MAFIIMRISQLNYEKSVGKGHLFEKAYVKFFTFLDTSCRPLRHLNDSDFISLWNASLWELSNQTMKKVLERGTFLKRQSFYSLNTRVKGAPGCPLSPGARGFAHPEPIGVTPLIWGTPRFQLDNSSNI